MNNSLALHHTSPNNHVHEQIDFISTSKREFMSLVWTHMAAVIGMVHLPDLMFEFVTDDGSVAAYWDEASHIGIVDMSYTYCPVGLELDSQLSEAVKLLQ